MAAQHPVTDVNAVEHETEEEKAKQEAAATKIETLAKFALKNLKRKLLIQQTLKVTATVNDVAESVKTYC